MNPDTGRFHELALAEHIEKSGDVRKRHLARRRKEVKGDEYIGDLHPGHVDLIIAASKKRVPAHWPIFTTEEKYTIEVDDPAAGGLTKFEVQLEDILPKDLVLGITSRSFSLNFKNKIFELKGHEFRIRYRVELTLIVRPVIGSPRNYI